MGWLYYAATKKALIADRTAAWKTDGVRGTTIAFCVRGNRLWKVVEIEYHKDGTKERYIALDLLACHGRWGYKDLYEAAHPFYFDCPLGYLAQVAVECEKWREGVHAYHARIHRRVEIGQRIVLSGSRIPWVRIVSVRPLRGEYRGTVHRLPRAAPRRGASGERAMSAALKCIEDRDEDEPLIARALEILARRHARGKPLTAPDVTQAYLRLWLAERPCEIFGAIFLDTKNRVLACEELFTGTIDAAQVYPRVVAQRALQHNAAALVVFHNHPSGVAEPSRADECLNHRLKDALSLLDIRLLDHMAVSAEGSVSMAERGLL